MTLNAPNEGPIAGLRQGLQGPDRMHVLLKLMHELTIAGRASYPSAGLTRAESQAALECINELQIVVLKQLTASVLGEPPAYPEDAFIEVLAEKAGRRACGAQLETAARRATRTDSRDPFDRAYIRWLHAGFPEGSEVDAVDELHAELAQWDAFVQMKSSRLRKVGRREPG